MGQVHHGKTATTTAAHPSSDYNDSQESLKSSGQALRDQPEDRGEVEETNFGDRSAAVRRSRGRRCFRLKKAVIVAFRRYTLLPLDDCLYALQPTIPHLTRSSLHRCLQRHGIGRLPDVEGNKPAKKKFKAYPIGYFHIDIAEVRTAEGKLNLGHRREKLTVPTRSTPCPAPRRFSLLAENQMTGVQTIPSKQDTL
jgi:hypothetical protein